MSEFSVSLHLRGSDASQAVALLRRAGVAGYVFPGKAGWIPLVYLEPTSGRVGSLDRIIAANEGLLLHYAYSPDHAFDVDIYEHTKRVGKLTVNFETTKRQFDRDAFVARSLMTAKEARSVEVLLANLRDCAPPGLNKMLASALGLSRFSWFAYRYEVDAEARAEGRIEVDAAGAARTSGPDDEELDIEELLASLPPTRKRAAPRAVPGPNAEEADALEALQDVTSTLTVRETTSASTKRSPTAKASTTTKAKPKR